MPILNPKFQIGKGGLVKWTCYRLKFIPDVTTLFFLSGVKKEKLSTSTSFPSARMFCKIDSMSELFLVSVHLF